MGSKNSSTRQRERHRQRLKQWLFVREMEKLRQTISEASIDLVKKMDQMLSIERHVSSKGN
jgi:hypothetical protein